jgi:formylglycine-generating enzyme
MKWPTITTLLALLLVACASPGSASTMVPLYETGIDSAAWARVPAGDFYQGQHDRAASIKADYEMMVTPVTNAQYADFLNLALAAGEVQVAEGAVTGFYPGDTYRAYKHEVEVAAGDWALMPTDDPALRLTFDGTTFSVKPGYGNHPATMVSWFGAWAYCTTYDWRLPTDAEWEKAARGTDTRPYPWGDEVTAAHANFVDSRDPFEGNSETSPVGFYNGSTYDGFETLDAASPYGLYDLAGNVWEWTGDVRVGTHHRSLRGGSFVNYAYNLRIWTINNAQPQHTSPRVGFRCARDG